METLSSSEINNDLYVSISVKPGIYINVPFITNIIHEVISRLRLLHLREWFMCNLGIHVDSLKIFSYFHLMHNIFIRGSDIG